MRWPRWGDAGDTAPAARAGDSRAKSMRSGMEPNGFASKLQRSLARKAPFCVTSFMSANTWPKLPRVAEPKFPTSGAGPKQKRLKRGALEKVIQALAEHLEPPDTPQ